MESIYSRKNSSSALSSRAKGRYMEQQACVYLQRAGLILLATNVQYRCGELDLIMRDQQTLVFVEVRYRRNDHYGDAAATVTWPKQRRIIRAAGCWLLNQGQSLVTSDCRFDVLAITAKQVQWLKNAFY